MIKQRISLVIPAYNEEKYLGACLAAVQKQVGDLHEVIVVDNASTDRTAEVAASFPGVRVVHESEKGVTRARERGRREAGGEVVAYIDADTIIPLGWTAHIHEAFAKIPDLVCLSGPCVYYDFSPTKKFLTTLYWQVLARPASWLTGYLAIGGNLVVRRDALEQIGGFDRSINFYGEDTDVARRLAQVGRVVFRHQFYLETSARRLQQEGWLRMAWRYAKNFLSVAWRHRPATLEYQDIR